jgi:hypothetical protein
MVNKKQHSLPAKIGTFIKFNLLVPLGLSKSDNFVFKAASANRVLSNINIKFTSVTNSANLKLKQARRRMYYLMTINIAFLVLSLALKSYQTVSFLLASLLLWLLFFYAVWRAFTVAKGLIKGRKSQDFNYIKAFLSHKGHLPYHRKRASRVVFNQYYNQQFSRRQRLTQRYLVHKKQAPTKNELFEYSYYRMILYWHDFWRISVLYFTLLLLSYSVVVIVHRIIIFRDMYGLSMIYFLEYPFLFFGLIK